jgi:hypothetical protein
MKFWGKIAFIWILVWLASFFAFGQQQTPNLGLVIQTPPPMANNWSAIVNYDFQRIDSLVGPYAPNYRGNWSGSLTYSKGQFVTYPTSTGTVYMSLIDSNLNHNPSSTPLNWYAIANGSATGTVTSFAAPSAGWPSWLVPTVTNPSTTPSLGVVASSIPFSALANLSANQLLGSLAGGAPGGLSVPDCHTSGVSALIWTAATGFSCNSISSGTTVNINGSPVSNPNLNGSSPSPDASFIAAAFKVSGSNAIVQVPYGTNSAKGALACDGTTTTCSGGVVTATASASGVQYNASSTLYLFGGPDSIVGDDSHIYGTKFTVSSFSCNTGVGGVYTCTVNTSSAHGLTVATWVTPEAQMTGWPGVPSPFAAWSTPYDLFQITAVPTSTSLQFTTTWASVSGISGSGGTIEDASYFMPVLTSKEPFFNGHGSIDWALPIGSTIASLNSNYSTVIHPRLVAWQVANPGAKMYLIVTGGRNDLQACTSNATLETDLLAIAANAHTDGAEVIFNTITPSTWNNSNIGCLNVYYNAWDLNNWAKAQLKVNATITGQYFDHIVDQYGIMNNLKSLFLASAGGLNDIGRAAYAKQMNNAMSSQDSVYTGFPDFIAAGPPTGGTFTTDGSPVFVNSDDASSFGLSVWSHAKAPLMGWTGGQVQLYTIANSPCIGQTSTYQLALKQCLFDPGSNGVLKRTSGNVTAVAGFADIVAMWASGSCSSGYLKFDGTCSTPSGSGGTVTYTTSATASSGDAGKLVIMNCASACSYTLPASQPSTTWFANITTQGSSSATIVLGGADTFNGTTSVPVLNKFRLMKVYANSAVATDYSGEAPLHAGTNITFTPTANQFDVAAAGGGSGTNVNINAGSTLATSQQDGILPYICADSSGSGTAQTCTTTTAFTVTSGNCFVYKTTTANTGTGLTVNANSLGAKSVAIPGSSGWTTTLTVGIIPANKPLTLCYDGTNLNAQQTGTLPSSGATTLYQIDNFVSKTVPGFSLGWTSATAGSGTSITTQQSNTFPGHAGVIKLDSGTTSAGWQMLSLGNDSAGAGPFNFDGSSGIQSFTAEVLVPTMGNLIARFGVTYRTNMFDTRYIDFACLSSNAVPTDWYYETFDGTTLTSTDSGISCNNAWHQLEIKTNNTSATFYIDGTSVGTGTAPGTTGMIMAFAVQSTASSTNRFIDVDWAAVSTQISNIQ